ncbi:MAG: primosomal protein N' [Candidatus Aminicenantes bacterium]|nr:primosomal protein N' [Candidatus Aminicenantes bacterium]
MDTYCEVSFPLPVIQTFLYRLPEELRPKVKIGSRVLAPLGKRKLIGYVMEIKPLDQELHYKVKEIIKIIEAGPDFSESFVNFIREIAAHSLTSPGLFLEMAEVSGWEEKLVYKVVLTEKGLAEANQTNLNLKREKREVLNLLKGRALTPNFLKRSLKIKNVSSLLDSLKAAGLIEIREKKIKKREINIVPSSWSGQLSLPGMIENRPQPVNRLLEKFSQKESGPYLLFGSFDARREFIEHLFESFIQRQKYCFLLVPEIQHLRKWESLLKIFKEDIVVIHSQLSEKKRWEAWQRVLSGKSRIILGTRSILFIPVQPVSLIILDEEQDDLYYQAERIAFDAREAAWLRAKQEKGLLIFSSSYPEVSHYWQHQKEGTVINVGQRENLYSTVFALSDVDELLRKELKAEVEKRLISGEQVFFLVNRKGYSSHLFCPGCGYVPRCQKCQIVLTLEKEKELHCRYCGQIIPVYEKCPVCGRKMRTGKIRGSRYWKEKLEELFPGREVALMEEGLNGKKEETLEKKISSGKIQLIIGTEYALPRLGRERFSLVVAINPELNLNLPDFKAAFKTFVNQFKGAELLRNEPESKLVVVSNKPDHPAIREGALMNYQGFFESELEYRHLLNYPPFSYLVGVTISSDSLRASGRFSRLLFNQLNECFPEVEIIGPKITRHIWRKAKKEIKFYLRLNHLEEIQNLRTFLIDFRKAHPAARIYITIW